MVVAAREGDTSRMSKKIKRTRNSKRRGEKAPCPFVADGETLQELRAKTEY
jgi:hypothetical protein